MRRVLFVVADLEPDGAQRVVANLACHLPRAAFEVHVALVCARGRLLHELPPDVQWYDLGGGRVRTMGPRIARLAWKLRPDVLVSTLGYVNLMLILTRPLLPRGIPVVVREANRVSSEIEGFAHPRLWAAAYRLLYPRATRIVCNASVVADDLAERFAVPRERLDCLPNPVDYDAVQQAARAAGSPFHGPGPHLLGAGRLVSQKGFDRLIDAFARVAQMYPEARLWILGRGREQESLARRADRLGLSGRVVWPGQVSDPYRWLGHADLFILSSRFEGMPNVLLEALACGTRCAAFDVPGGVREVIEGVPGTELVPDGNIDALVHSMEHLIGPEAPPPPVLPSRFRLEAAVGSYAALLGSVTGR